VTSGDAWRVEHHDAVQIRLKNNSLFTGSALLNACNLSAGVGKATAECSHAGLHRGSAMKKAPNKG
jgi:predicted small secreted protein